MSDFKPILGGSDKVSVTYQVSKLIREAFPSLATSALYKVDGLEDVAKQTLTDIGNGFKPSNKNNSPALGSFTIPSEANEESSLKWDTIVPLKLDQGSVRSYLGLPIFMPIYFMPDTYKYLSNGSIKRREIKEIFRLPAATLVELEREKIVQTTQLNGAIGTEKELWSFGDWSINIKGFVLNESSKVDFPAQFINKLAMYESLADSIRVSGGLFDLFKINRLVILGIGVSQIQGSPFKLAYNLRCVSDNSVEVRIKNRQ